MMFGSQNTWVLSLTSFPINGMILGILSINITSLSLYFLCYKIGLIAISTAKIVAPEKMVHVKVPYKPYF